MNKKIILTDKDYLTIREKAIQLFLDKNSETEYSNVKNIVEALLYYLKVNNYTVVDGEILKSD